MLRTVPHIGTHREFQVFLFDQTSSIQFDGLFVYVSWNEIHWKESLVARYGLLICEFETISAIEFLECAFISMRASIHIHIIGAIDVLYRAQFTIFAVLDFLFFLSQSVVFLLHNHSFCRCGCHQFSFSSYSGNICNM